MSSNVRKALKSIGFSDKAVLDRLDEIILDNMVCTIYCQTAVGHQVPEYVSCDVFISIIDTCTSELLESLIQVDAKSHIIVVPDFGLQRENTDAISAVDLKHLISSKDYYRIEGCGDKLIAVCGALADKGFKLSLAMPLRDEGHDIAKTLSSFIGITDELIIGVDPRTTDNTAEEVALYTDSFFTLDSPLGPPDEQLEGDACHFSWCRNQCIEKCTGDWILTTDGHTTLGKGANILLALQKMIPAAGDVIFVGMQNGGYVWPLPLLFRNNKGFKFVRATHNSLNFPKGSGVVKMTNQIVINHAMHKDRAGKRKTQRKEQNREWLLNDWLIRKNEQSLFYLGQEWSSFDNDRSTEYFVRFLEKSNNGQHKYQVRLILAKLLMLSGKTSEAKAILAPATLDDFHRNDHWIWLGDIAYSQKRFEEAYTYYSYATTMINRPPFTIWWINPNNYTYIPAQRMYAVCGELGRLEEGRAWTERMLELLPKDAPLDVYEEAQENIDLFNEQLASANVVEVTQNEVNNELVCQA